MAVMSPVRYSSTCDEESGSRCVTQVQETMVECRVRRGALSPVQLVAWSCRKSEEAQA